MSILSLVAAELLCERLTIEDGYLKISECVRNIRLSGRTEVVVQRQVLKRKEAGLEEGRTRLESDFSVQWYINGRIHPFYIFGQFREAFLCDVG